MRGDRPWLDALLTLIMEFTPHARGSTHQDFFLAASRTVYPACAGIDRRSSPGTGWMRCLPRMRGDRPGFSAVFPESSLFTPHARGSTPPYFFLQVLYHVYPACAGIDRRDMLDAIERESLPRMRGDRPSLKAKWLRSMQFTPHARGSTL